MKIIQDKNLYCFTSDSVVLANFASAKRGDIVADFGAGSGIISILFSAKNNCEKIFAVEIQEKMQELLEKNIIFNNFQEKIEIIKNSIQDFSKNNIEKFDVIISNPPYKKKGTSFQNQNAVKAIARHEIEIDLVSLCKSVQRSLKFGGKFFMCYDANRTSELLSSLSENGLEPKRLFFSQSGPERNATLVFVEARKGAKKGCEVLPVLVTNYQNGDYVPHILQNYKRK